MNFWQGQPSLTVVEWFLRATVTIFWLFLITKLMGQREIGRMTMFDFVVAIMIGSVTSSHLADSSVPITGALISIAAIGLVDILVAYVALKHSKLRRVFQDEPIVLIQNGQILSKMLSKTMFNLDDLMIELRLKNIPNIHDVEYAILEPNGQLSVIPKSQARPVTPEDLQIETPYEGLATVLVEDGNILQDNLRKNQLDEKWLLEELKKHSIDNVAEAMAVILDTRGRLYVSKKT